MDWKEEIAKWLIEFPASRATKDAIVLFTPRATLTIQEMKTFIETEIIEALIADIENQKCRCRCPENQRLEEVIQYLRQRWLNN